MTLEKAVGTLRIYGCGGTGVKRAHPFQGQPHNEGLADVSVTYVDTSMSDFAKDIDLEDCFLTEDTDGSGSKRSANPHIISSVIRQVPVKFAPGDVNVVIMSGIGGSGSVIGPLLCKELLMRDAPTIAIVVLSTVSQLAITNCLDTIKTLAGQSRLANKPLITLFHNNGANTDIDAVDEAIYNQITALQILASRSHMGLDTADVANVLNYTNVTGLEPQLSTMDIVTSVEELAEVSYPVTVCTVAKKAPDLSSIGMEHCCGGIMQHTYSDVDELHFATSITELPNVVKMLESALLKVKERTGSRPTTVKLVDANTLPDDGLFFS